MLAVGQAFEPSLRLHGSGLTRMYPDDHIGNAAGTHGIGAASAGLSQSMESYSQGFGNCIESHGRSLAGMTSVGNQPSLGIEALGHGFADMGQYISKSITFLSFALIARAVADIGYIYILSMAWMATITGLFLWNLRLQTCLASDRRSHLDIQSEVRRTKDALDSARELEAQLSDSRRSLANMETECNSVREELAKGNQKQKKTEAELEDARLLLLKMSNELTKARGVTQNATASGNLEDSTFMNASKEAELMEARRENARVNRNSLMPK